MDGSGHTVTPNPSGLCRQTLHLLLLGSIPPAKQSHTHGTPKLPSPGIQPAHYWRNLAFSPTLLLSQTPNCILQLHSPPPAALLHSSYASSFASFAHSILFSSTLPFSLKAKGYCHHPTHLSLCVSWAARNAPFRRQSPSLGCAYTTSPQTLKLKKTERKKKTKETNKKTPQRSTFLKYSPQPEAWLQPCSCCQDSRGTHANTTALRFRQTIPCCHPGCRKGCILLLPAAPTVLPPRC